MAHQHLKYQHDVSLARPSCSMMILSSPARSLHLLSTACFAPLQWLEINASITALTNHGVGLATACSAVGKHRRVDAI
eukprot:1159777-Pelagomonas_calceolata.AAC.5